VKKTILPKGNLIFQTDFKFSHNQYLSMDQRSGYNRPQPGYGHADNAGYQQNQGRNPAPQPVPKKEVQISQTAKEKAEAAKEFIESNYS